MVSNKCKLCCKQININFKRPKYKIPNATKHFFLCQLCKQNYILISKTQAYNKYILVDTDIINLKYLYFENINNISKMFDINDIKNAAILKHGTLKNMRDIRDKKQQQKVKIKLKKIYISEKRKQRLQENLQINKLCLQNYGDCYSYIHYGIPSLETVINNELKKQQKQQHKRLKLVNELFELNIKFDEKDKLCYNYIYNIGWRNFYETIRAIEMKAYLKNKKKTISDSVLCNNVSFCM
jgi:hypothetical protein